MCLANIPGDGQGKCTPQIYSRQDLFKIGKDYKNNLALFSNQTADFKNINNLGLQKQRGRGKINVRSQIKKTHQNGANTENLIAISTQNSEIEKKSCKLQLTLINARSIRANLSLLQTEILDSPQIVAITETWINTENDNFYVNEITPDGYNVITKNREKGRGGGVALISKIELKQNDITDTVFNSFEHATSTSRPLTFKIAVIYRPPSSSFTDFLEDFSSLLESFHQGITPFVIVGDFNIHVDIPDDAKTKRFMDLLYSFDLVQHVKTATHTLGHTLDLIISQRNSEFRISNLRLGELISDHFSIKLDLSTVINETQSKTVLSRNIKSIDMEAFRQDLSQSDLISNPETELTDLVNQYNTCLKSLLDKHAPLTRRSIKAKRNPWYTSDIHTLRTKKRMQQRRWKKSQLDSDLKHLKQIRDDLKTLISKTKIAYYRNRIQESSHNQGALFRTVKSLLHYQKDTPFFDKPALTFGNELNDYFISKIEKNPR